MRELAPLCAAARLNEVATKPSWFPRCLQVGATRMRWRVTLEVEPPSNKSLDRSAGSLFLNLFGAAKIECNRRARSSRTFDSFAL